MKDVNQYISQIGFISESIDNVDGEYLVLDYEIPKEMVAEEFSETTSAEISLRIPYKNSDPFENSKVEIYDDDCNFYEIYVDKSFVDPLLEIYYKTGGERIA